MLRKIGIYLQLLITIQICVHPRELAATALKPKTKTTGLCRLDSFVEEAALPYFIISVVCEKTVNVLPGTRLRRWTRWIGTEKVFFYLLRNMNVG